MSTIDYASELAKQQDAQAAADLERRNRSVFAQLLAKHGLLASAEGNFKLLVEFCRGELTLEGAEWLLDNPPQGLTLLFKDERNTWIEKIIALKHDPTNRRYTNWDAKNDRFSLAYKSRSELMTIHDNLVLKQSLAQRSASELRADLAAHRKAAEEDRPYVGYPTLLSTVVPAGQIQAVNTREYLQQIAKHDLESFKRFVRLYGSQQVTDIMQGRRY